MTNFLILTLTLAAEAAPVAETPEQALARQRQEEYAAYAAEVLPRFGAQDLDPANLPPLMGQALVIQGDITQGEWIALDAGEVPAQLAEPLCRPGHVLAIGHPSDKLAVPDQMVLDAARTARLGASKWYEGTMEPTVGSGYAVCVPESRVLPDQGWLDAQLSPIWAVLADHEGRLQALEEGQEGQDARLDALEDEARPWSLSAGAVAWAPGARYGAVGTYAAADVGIAGRLGLRGQAMMGRVPGQDAWSWGGSIGATFDVTPTVQLVGGVGNTDILDSSWHARAKNYGLEVGASWSPGPWEVYGSVTAGPWRTAWDEGGPPPLSMTPSFGVGFRF